MLCQKGQKKYIRNSCNPMHVEGVKRQSKYAVRAHSIFAHKFLNIQPIFNPKKVFKS